MSNKKRNSIAHFIAALLLEPVFTRQIYIITNHC